MATGRNEQLDMAGAAGTGQGDGSDGDSGDDGDGDGDGEHFWCNNAGRVTSGRKGCGSLP